MKNGASKGVRDLAQLNKDITVINDGIYIFAVDPTGRFFNSSTLQGQTQQQPAVGFLSDLETLKLISTLAPLPDIWYDPKKIYADRHGFTRALKTADIAYEVPGTAGRHAIILVGKGASMGERDYQPGLWIRIELALPLAKWLTRQVIPGAENPLVDFVSSAIGSFKLPSSAPRKVKRVAPQFAHEVSPKILELLESVDEQMIADGEPAGERLKTLQTIADRNRRS